jgi:hypothetical protein
MGDLDWDGGSIVHNNLHHEAPLQACIHGVIETAGNKDIARNTSQMKTPASASLGR